MLNIIFLFHPSSMSTALNSMAAVVLEDFYKTWFSHQLSPLQTNILMKTVVVVVGAICVGLVFVVEKLGAVLQVRIFCNSSVMVLEPNTFCDCNYIPLFADVHEFEWYHTWCLPWNFQHGTLLTMG
jgi:hypothetical protein